jgi:ABC-type amino acid transport substrate-binding protein
MAAGDEAMATMVNAWVDLKKKDGTVQRLYDYWVLGKNAEKKQARWSVIRDVLGWVD